MRMATVILAANRMAISELPHKIGLFGVKESASVVIRLKGTMEEHK